MREKKLNEKQRKAIEEDWFNRMPDQLEAWLAGLPEALQKQLDYSPESILPLQEYLWKHYDSTNITYPENKEEIESISYYYGELHRKYMPIEFHWECYDVFSKPDISPMHLKNDEYINAFSDIFREVVVSVSENERDESTLEWYFNGRLKYCQRLFDNQELIANLEPVVPGRGGYSYQYFLLQKNKENTLSGIENTLKEYFSTQDNPPDISFHNDCHLLVKMDEDYYFHITHDSRDEVADEIQELAQDYSGSIDRKELSQCQSRLEFWGDEDHNLDYMNDALWILQEISELPDIVTTLDVKTGEELAFTE